MNVPSLNIRRIVHQYNANSLVTVSEKHEEMDFEGASDCDSGDDWDEAESSPCSTITCLFCKEEFTLYDDATQHLDDAHNFSLAKIVRKIGLDDYTYRKLVNYIRLENARASEISSMKDGQAWESNKYLAPVIQDDAWLMLGKSGFSPLPYSQLCKYIYSFLSGKIVSQKL